MTMFLAPYTAIADIDGSPLDAGFLFFGEYGKDPELFPVEVFWDADFTVPAAQPIRTRNGYPVRNGSPTKVYLKTAQHSIVIKNRNSAFILVDFNNKGWSADFVVDGSENQHDINNKTIRFFKSMNELLLSKPKKNGQLVTLFAYHEGGQLGGGDLIAIQSSILIENGVTVFRSNVVGYEDYFWVRVNISHITPEMAGAIGDKTYNCRDAFRACFSVGGKIKLRENAKYLLSSEGLTAAPGETIILIDVYQNFELVCDGWAEMYFKSEHPSNSVVSAYFNNTNLTLTNAKIRNVGWFGHTEIGHSAIANRTYCPHFVGTHNPDLKNIRSSTFRSHTIHFTRRITDWIQSSDLNQANTEAAVKRLMENSCKNVKLRNIRVDNCASTGISMFGVDGLDASGIRADMTGALYDHAIWTDDASSQTKLSDYSLNRNIHIRDVVGGSIHLMGCVSGSVRDCDLKQITVRSYDFDQQKNNFDSGTHTYNPDDHLSQPFLWQQWFDRGITLHDNAVDRIEIQSIYVDAHDNFIRTTGAGQSLVVLDRNGIRWGTGIDYFDQELTTETGIKNNVKNNTYLVRHDNCVGIDYGTASANSFVNAIDNIVEKRSPTLNFTPIRYSNSRFRRDSYFETSGNNGTFLTKRYNHLVDVMPNLLMQGLGTSNLKTFFSVAANKSAQGVARFTAAQKVFFLANILDSEGRYYRKKVEVTAANTLTVTDLDSQTIYNTGFTLVVNSGVKQLNFGSSTYNVNIDVQGIGVRGDCVFYEPENRLRTDV